MKEQQSFIQFNNKKDLETEFKIITLKNLFENKKNLPFDLQKPHISKHYSILIITTGIGHHTLDLKKHDFTNGSFLFIAKDQMQSFDFKPGNGGYLISFSEEFLNRAINSSLSLSHTWLYNYHLQRPKIQVKAVEQDYFFDIVKRMYREYQTKNKFAGEEILQTLLNLLLLECERKKHTENSNSNHIDYSNIFFNFKILCEEKYSETRNAKYYADLLNISYKHLNNICKQCINKTAKQFIDDFIITESKRYLLSSEKSVREISEQTGFDEATNFVKYFKKHTGFSPDKYRKKNQL